MTTLIFDTTPLNHFALAGRLAVLERLTASYRRVVAQAVLDELRVGETHHPPLADVRNAEWLEMVACDGLGMLAGATSPSPSGRGTRPAPTSTTEATALSTSAKAAANAEALVTARFEPSSRMHAAIAAGATARPAANGYSAIMKEPMAPLRRPPRGA